MLSYTALLNEFLNFLLVTSGCMITSFSFIIGIHDIENVYAHVVRIKLLPLIAA